MIVKCISHRGYQFGGIKIGEKYDMIIIDQDARKDNGAAHGFAFRDSPRGYVYPINCFIANISPNIKVL